MRVPVLSEVLVLAKRGGIARELLCTLFGFALGAGATFWVWRQDMHRAAPLADPTTAAAVEGIAAAQAAATLAPRPQAPMPPARTASTPAGPAPPPSAAASAPAAPPPSSAGADVAAAAPSAPNVAVAVASVASPATTPATTPAAAPSSAAAASAALDVLSVEVDNVFDGTGYDGAWHQRTRAAPGTQVTYGIERRGERVSIAPTSALHKAAQDATPLPPALTAVQSVQWQLPRLTLRFKNTTDAALRIVALELQVVRSAADNAPLLFVPSEAGGTLEVENVGWGRAMQAELKFGFAPAQAFDTTDARTGAATEVIKLEDIDERLRVDLRQRVPAALRASGATLFGTLNYTTEAGEQRALPFKSLVRVDRGGAARRGRAKFFHHVLLPAGKLGVTALPLNARLAPGKTLETKLRVASDRSTRHEVLLALKGADGTTLAAQLIELQVFVPRFDAGGIVRTPSAVRVADN